MTRTLFANANLLDGEHAARPNTTVVVEAERITRVSGEREAPGPGDRLVDLAGRTLMPGMVSSHFHSTYDSITIMPQPLGLESPPGYLALVAARHLRFALESGFTSVISGGAINEDTDAQLKLAIRNGIIEGPRLMAGSRGLDTTGGYTDTESWWWNLGNHGAQRFCDGPDQFRHAVRDEIKRGAEIIKLFASGGHAVQEEIEESSFTFEEVRACVEAAHQRGKKVRAHSVWRQSILDCVKAGVDLVDHADYMDDEIIEKMVQQGTYVLPSMYFVNEWLKDAPNIVQATEAQLRPIRDEYENIRRVLPTANEAGVKLLIGDDYGILCLAHGVGEYAKELEFYVKEIGIPPLDVIRWATRNGGEFMGLGAGTVEEGRLADLLVVDGDPSVDIGLLHDPAKLLAIVKGGAFFKDELG